MDGQTYRIVVAGELGPRFAAAFEGMTCHSGNGLTEIRGVVRDRAHLSGLLDRIDNLGLRLISASPVDDTS